MIHSLTVKNYLDESIEFNLPTSHEELGVYIKSIEGIGPSKSNINIASLASDDGGVFTSARTEVRNITINLGFYESSILHNSIEESRHLIYKYFPNKKYLRLTFKTDERNIYIDGFVESNEPDIFSRDEGTTISIICPDPNFYSVLDDSYVMDNVLSEFEFEFENDTVDIEVTQVPGLIKSKQIFLTSTPAFQGEKDIFYYVRKADPNLFDEWIWLGSEWYKVAENKRIYQPILVFSELDSDAIYEVPYYGETETGILLTIHFIQRATNITIVNEDINGSMFINTSVVESILSEYYEEDDDKVIKPNDDIIISTKNGNKFAEFIRGTNDPINIINAIIQKDNYPTWFKLQKGINKFTFSAETGKDDIQIIIENPVAYEGV